MVSSKKVHISINKFIENKSFFKNCAIKKIGILELQFHKISNCIIKLTIIDIKIVQ